ncbi:MULTISPECIES: DUF1697 domain-containing protein [Dehalobacter]|jgi:uncharacterized protein (DUF1697 family)|uniref:DUF1697 domain-containing protein n=2 Tax=Dehalobacter restrictus TaxID=55583 RepID=A0A857DFT9_9FIRM|nr:MULTISPECIES: DUF1697 domain-containing protein [Dehalobacter]AHF08984.1 hypothetical protein DEHRE_01670 [Dehalobacter restrictus DSM 9455]MCG1026645.1 DUF1697 domain-containing protein [Dehalobacter sp.]MDJ0306099.1 DUF1697 domain-containing protein [Dehalobacter sp.]OCZ50934.1 hypothetical protein A7D23_15255 [Dehalobacter sp. TeCB1]QGZ99507.1 DUF1697 domain-containing protein [Dehalobacter restrictus]
MKYIALLRGINVGGKNKVSMHDLKNCFENAGFLNTRTYINSGNVIFDSEEQSIIDLSSYCNDILKKKFDFPIGIALIDVNTLKEALENVPDWWGYDQNSKHNAIFVIQPATAEEIIADAGKMKPEYEQLYAYKEIIFWSAPLKTFSRTRWSKIVGTKAYQSITIRNANTTKKLLEMAQS